MMLKRRTKSTSSCSDGKSSSSGGSSKSSIDDSTFAGYCGAEKKMSALPTAMGSRKKARNASSEEIERRPVATTSAQLHRELGIIVKGESEESEDSEVEQLMDSLSGRMDRACSNSSAARQSNPEVRRSTRERVPSKRFLISKDPKKPKKAPVLKPHEKYFDGCLVMAWYGRVDGFPWWPGIIRKSRGDTWYEPTATDYVHTDTLGRIWFCVQFFTSRTFVGWRLAEDMRVFDPARPNRCNYWDPAVVERFEKGIQIAKAAANFSVEARLAKFTLLSGAKTECLLNEIENGQHALQNDSVAHDEDRSAHPAQRNRPSFTDLVAELKKQAELLKKKDLEKEEANKALIRDNSKLTAELKKVKATNRDLTLQLQSKKDETGNIERLEGKLKTKDKLNAELRAKLKRSEKDKLGYMEELEKMRSAVESLQGVFNGVNST